jgi:hypothetical protein
MVDKLEATGLEALEIMLSPLVGVCSDLAYIKSISGSSISFFGNELITS